MNHIVRKILLVFRSGVFLIIGLIVVTVTTLEFIFSPTLIGKYYIPAMIHRHSFTSDFTLSFFYMLFLMIQVFNILAALMLFMSIFLTSYHDHVIAYDTVMLCSIALSLSLMLHTIETDHDVYEKMVEKDIYIQISRIGDVVCTGRAQSPSTSSLAMFSSFNPDKKDDTATTLTTTLTSNNDRKAKMDGVLVSLAHSRHSSSASSSSTSCRYTDVYLWHQMNQCCGWTSAQDLVGVFKISVRGRGGAGKKENTTPNPKSDNNHSSLRWSLRSWFASNENDVNDQGTHGDGGDIIGNGSGDDDPDQLLPDFCCLFTQPAYFMDLTGAGSTNSRDKRSRRPCSVVHPKRFNRTCLSRKKSFLALRSVSMISNPVNWSYIMLKLFGALSYTFAKHHMLPQSEGHYSFFIVP